MEVQWDDEWTGMTIWPLAKKWGTLSEIRGSRTRRLLST